MKIAKRIYFCALPIMLALFLALSFVHVFNGGNKTAASEQFLQNAKRYAKTIYDAQNDSLNDSVTKYDDTKAVRTAIETSFNSSSMDLRKASNSGTKVLYEAENDEDSNFTVPRVPYSKSGTYTITNWYTQTAALTPQKQIEIAKAQGLTDYEIALDRTVNNVVVVIPGQKSKQGLYGDAILFTVHMDSPKLTSSAADASSIGVALAQIFELTSHEKSANNTEMNAKYENDIVFLFTDARYDASIGVQTFFEQFYGFYQVGTGTTNEPEIPDLVSRIKFAINFDSLGIGDSAMLLQASTNNSRVVSEFAKSMGATVSSSFVSDFYKGFASDFNAYGELNALNLVTFGGNNLYSTAGDNYEAISDSVYLAKADLVINSVKHFGSMDLSTLDSNSDSVYFSFLGLFTVVYANYVSYILGAIILALFGLIIAFNIKTKSFSFKVLAKACAVQIVSLLATIGSMFVLYFFLALILSGLRLFTIQSITTFVYTNAGILIGWTLFGVIMLSLFYSITRKVFSKNKPISAISLVRGGVFVFSAIAAILSFVYPSLAYMFAIPAMLLLGVMLETMLYKKIDLNRYFTYLWPILFGIALIVPVVTMLGFSVRAVLVPIMLLPLLSLLTVCSPYILMFIKPIDELLKKLPRRTIRVQRTVIESVEDKAKPGKFTETKLKKITNEKIEWRYRHGVGTAVIATISAILIMACSSLSVPFGANAFINPSQKDPMSQYTNSIYQDSLILSWKGSGISSEMVKPELQIHDKGAFKYFNYALNGYSWDASQNAYVKQLSTNMMNGPTVVVNGGRLSITPVDFCNLGMRGIMEVTLHDIDDVINITVFDDGNEKHKMDVTTAQTLTLRFPLDSFSYHNIDLEFETKTGARISGFKFTVNQYIWDYLTGSSLTRAADSNMYKESAIREDVRNALDYFASDTATQRTVRFGVVYEQTYEVDL